MVNTKSQKDLIVRLFSGLPKAPKALPNFSGKGQFFSSDLIIALVVFTVILAFFYVSSQSLTTQINIFYAKNQLEEVSHTTISPLVLFSGEPYDWEIKSFSDLNRVGLVKEKNVLSVLKVNKFIEYLDNNYTLLREKLALGKYDIKFQIQDFNGSIIKEGGVVNQDFVARISQRRIASYENRQVMVLRVISYAE